MNLPQPLGFHPSRSLPPASSVVREVDSGKRFADKLMKVWRHDGEKLYVVIHVEVQGQLWGCQASLSFPVVKLRDYNERWAELEVSTNPFAIVVMSHLKSKRHEPYG